MKTKSIKQNITFDAAPEEVCQLIMNPKAHSAFTGSEVTMSTKINGKFRVFDGYCSGYNIELVEGKKLSKLGILKKRAGPKTTSLFVLLYLKSWVKRQNFPLLKQVFPSTK